MSKMMMAVSFLAGTDLAIALMEAKDKAIQLDLVYITFKFNDTDFNIGQRADLDKAADEYHKGNKFIVQS